MISEEMISERKDAILKDMDTVKNRLEELEKARLENIALQNALMGALQQCDDFLKKIDDVSGDEG
tara:strand:+ start:300 stop:494 length:195 start_codon:yes stop_codon:yes gene_type:complete